MRPPLFLLKGAVPALVLAIVPNSNAEEPLTYKVTPEVAQEGFDVEAKMCWVHARAGAIPASVTGGDFPRVVLTMQKLLLTGSDVFYALNDIQTTDGGQTWTAPREHAETLGRREEPGGTVVAMCDVTPAWHAKTGVLLGIGHTVRYQDNKVMKVRRRETAYTVFDPETGEWSVWKTLQMPDEPRFQNAGAGCVQRVDLPDGDILLPIYHKAPEDSNSSVCVLRCGFEGETLSVKEIGNSMTVPAPRGLGEPSLTSFQGRYFLTLRNDEAGYVTSGEDGLHFPEPKAWTFDDGEPLGNYNTQQHWVTHSDGLFLVYTRSGANNDHVFRHRAPLFMARVDPERLVVLRDTETIVVPEKGARLGNFGVVNISPDETWITAAEWMQTTKPDPHDFRVPMKYGANNRVWFSRIQWSKPNERY